MGMSIGIAGSDTSGAPRARAPLSPTGRTTQHCFLTVVGRSISIYVLSAQVHSGGARSLPPVLPSPVSRTPHRPHLVAFAVDIDG